MYTLTIPSVLVSLAVLAVWTLLGKKVDRLPPGPKKQFLIGNLLDMPSKYTWVKFREWGKVYGDVVHVNVLGRDYVILNSMEAIRELLEKRGSNYSDRPFSIMTGELVGISRGLVLLRYGAEWKRQRKLARQGLRPEAVEQYATAMEEATHSFLAALSKRPEELMDQLRLWSGRIILGTTYGHLVEDREDELLRKVEDLIDVIGKTGTPRAFLVEVLPILRYVPRWFPYAGFKRLAYEGRQLSDWVMDTPFDRVKRDMEKGTAKPSFTSTLLSEAYDRDASPEEYEYSLKLAAHNLSHAGTETTFSTAATFLLMMTTHPQVLTKLQAELDQVTGSHPRFLTLEDKNDVPYFWAVIREVLRWKVPGPLGVAHKNVEADVYKGYHIPKGATVVSNIWSISQDVDDPEDFRPERWIGYEPTKDLTPDPLSYAFGFGRRACPGSHLAMDALFLLLTTSVMLYDFSEPENFSFPGFRHGVITFPLDFRSKITLRNSAIARDLLSKLAARSYQVQAQSSES